MGAKLAALAALVVGIIGFAPSATATNATGVIKVQGNHLVSRGHVVRLLGVQPQGLESQCENPEYGEYFDGPHNLAAVKAMKGWGANAVRITLNESCWLGRHVTGAGAPYRKAVVHWVDLFLANGVYVVVDNHTATDGTIVGENLPMADDSAVALWKSLASTFKSSDGVLFDLYNEPHGISWKCWRDGCRVPGGTVDGVGLHYDAYHSPGLQALVDAVRSTGAKQPILLGGLEWANDDSKWQKFAPNDPLHQLVVSQHTYGPSPDNPAAPCGRTCRSALAKLAKHHPVVIAELGEVDCKHAYIDKFMKWADNHGVGYIGGAWNAIKPGSYQCDSPALLENYDFPNPKPSRYGVGLRDHLRELAGR
jgi:hypothetical protein